MQRPPRKASDPVISSRLMWRVLSSGALIVVGTLWVFSLGMTQVRTTFWTLGFGGGCVVLSKAFGPSTIQFFSFIVREQTASST